MREIIHISKLFQNTGQIEGLPANPRFIRDEKFEGLKKSLQDDPEMLELRELIVIPYEDGYVIIGGNMRHRAAQEIGIEELPCKILPADTPIAKLRAYTIKDNVAYGSWDNELLGIEWDASELIDWSVDSVNKFDGDIDSLFKEAEESAPKEKAPHYCPHCGKNIYEPQS